MRREVLCSGEGRGSNRKAVGGRTPAGVTEKKTTTMRGAKGKK